MECRYAVKSRSVDSFLSLFMNTSNIAYDYMGDKCTSFYRYFQYIFPTY